MKLPPKLDALTLFVADPVRSKAFYGRLFGIEPIYEDENAVAFSFGELALNLLRFEAAPELIEPAPVAEPGGAAQSMTTVAVEDVDATATALVELGVTILNGPIDRPWGIRTVAFLDPDGHAWEVAQPIRAVAT